MRSARSQPISVAVARRRHACTQVRRNHRSARSQRNSSGHDLRVGLRVQGRRTARRNPSGNSGMLVSGSYLSVAPSVCRSSCASTTSFEPRAVFVANRFATAISPLLERGRAIERHRPLVVIHGERDDVRVGRGIVPLEPRREPAHPQAPPDHAERTGDPLRAAGRAHRRSDARFTLNGASIGTWKSRAWRRRNSRCPRTRLRSDCPDSPSDLPAVADRSGYTLIHSVCPNRCCAVPQILRDSNEKKMYSRTAIRKCLNIGHARDCYAPVNTAAQETGLGGVTFS